MEEGGIEPSHSDAEEILAKPDSNFARVLIPRLVEAATDIKRPTTLEH